MLMFDALDRWYARVHEALAEALAMLADCDHAPLSDGVLGEWVDSLCTLRFTAEDLHAIARIVGKRDPLLQEAGVRLAAAALERLPSSEELDAALAELVARPLDSWVLRALIAVLRRTARQLPEVYEGLARVHRTPPKGHGIARNMHIDAWAELEQVYEQHAIQTIAPARRDLAYLPILERRLGTRGWEATQREILKRMGYDHAQHLALLRRRP
jgi:hypothetical protein